MEDFYRADAVASLGNGNLAISYWHESSGKVFLRTFGSGGFSAEVELATTQLEPGAPITDMTALADGSVVVAVREDIDIIKGYRITPSGSGAPARSELFSLPAGGALHEPKVTALKGGGFAVTWMDVINLSARLRIATGERCGGA